MSDVEPDLSDALYCQHQRLGDSCEDCAADRYLVEHPGTPTALGVTKARADAAPRRTKAHLRD